MPVATVTFRKCILNSQEAGSDDCHLGSRVYFDLDIDGTPYPSLFTDVRQLVGSDSENEFLDVSMPRGYAGPFNFQVFRGSVEFYYRHVIGVHASMFGMRGIRTGFIGYVLEQEMRVQFEVLESGTCP